MSKVIYYKQCRLTKKHENGYWQQVSWIPEQFAVKDKVLKLKDSDGVWENGWVVTGAGTNRLAENMLPDYHVLIKGHRKMTGDAEPKKPSGKEKVHTPPKWMTA
jgi:hypothetical protein